MDSASQKTPAKIAFGRLLRELRLSRSLDQTSFGDRFGGYDRRAISAIENGTRAPQKRLLMPLRAAFPKAASRIDEGILALEAEKRAAAPQSRPRRRSASAGRIDHLLRLNRRTDARLAIEDELRQATEPGERAFLLERLGDVLASLGLEDEALGAYGQAVETAEAASLTNDALRLVEIITEYLLTSWNYTEAERLLVDHLGRHTTSSALWFCKALLQWHQGDFVGSYSSFTTAADHGYPNESILAHRGQVLAEWGSFESAVQDLDQALSTSLDPVLRSCALSARGYALSSLASPDDSLTALEMLGSGWKQGKAMHHPEVRDDKVFMALSDFRSAETIGATTVLHYFRALSSRVFGWPYAVFEELVQSLGAISPKLSRARVDTIVQEAESFDARERNDITWLATVHGRDTFRAAELSRTILSSHGDWPHQVVIPWIGREAWKSHEKYIELGPDEYLKWYLPYRDAKALGEEFTSEYQQRYLEEWAPIERYGVFRLGPRTRAEGDAVLKFVKERAKSRLTPP